MTVSEAAQASTGVEDRIPLSFNQEFLCLFDKGDAEGPFGPRYNIVAGWRLHGPVDPGTVHQALADLVERHETLRTQLVRGEEKYQKVLPPTKPELEVRDLADVEPADRDRRAEELLIELEGNAYDPLELPLVHGILAPFADDDWVLALVAHHAAVDQWSLQLMIRDVATRYAIRAGHDVPDLPELHQYREYAVWERERAAAPAAERARGYWREKLSGAHISPQRTDRPRSANVPKGTSVYRFLVGADLTSATLQVARSMRSSAFMVLLAVYKQYLRETKGLDDVTVPTLPAGRDDPRFDQTVGSFFNYLPLRTDLAGCGNFWDVLARTRRTCLEAYKNDLPFSHILEESPDIVSSFAGDDVAVVAFEVLQLPFPMDRELIGDVAYSDIRRLRSQEVTIEIPDGALLTLDIDPASGQMFGSVEYNSNLYDESTMSDLVAGFVRVLRKSVIAPDAALDQGRADERRQADDQ